MKRTLLVAVFVLGCGGGGSDTPPDAASPDTVALRGTCDAETRLGGFLVEVGDGFSGIAGKVENGTLPVAIPEVVLEDGDCRLLKRLNPFCDPTCAAGTVCDHDGTCISQPVSQNVGDVTITGLAEEVTMMPVEPGNNYFATGLPHPVIAAGALATLTSTDGFAGEMILHGVGPQALAGLDTEWAVEAGTAITVSWTPPTGSVRTRVQTELNIDQHGLTPVTIVCDFEDTGTGTISAAAVDKLLSTGISGFPRGRITRSTIDSMDAAGGCVDFGVETARRVDVRVVQ